MRSSDVYGESYSIAWSDIILVNAVTVALLALFAWFMARVVF
jgi:hypothetical protein